MGGDGKLGSHCEQQHLSQTPEATTQARKDTDIIRRRMSIGGVLVVVGVYFTFLTSDYVLEGAGRHVVSECLVDIGKVQRTLVMVQ